MAETTTDIFIKPVRVRVDQQLITRDAIIHPDGFCCATFYNQGETTALLMNSTKIKPGAAHSFNFSWNEKITSDLSLSFPDGNGGEVVLTKIYKTIEG